MEMKPLDSNTWTGEGTVVISDGDLIGTEDVARLLGIKIDRVRYLSRQNRLPSKTLSNHGQRIFSKKEILELEKPY
tara:strand:- start:522 stop:749 length:228 start_codon:yes stop_codon:yes gene_type:complete